MSYLVTVNRRLPYVNREISWLAFNDRVLQEASDHQVPLIERLRFLAIFSSNLDEFYRVRVATLNRLSKLNTKTKNLLGFSPKRILNEIKSIVLRQEQHFDYLFEKEIIPQLASHRIYVIKSGELDEEKGNYVRHYFREKIMPNLVPLILKSNYAKGEFPELKDRRIYFLVKLIQGKRKRYALVEIPTKVLDRFLQLPSSSGGRYVILLEDAIRYCLDELFFIFEHDKIEAYAIQLTRDAELDIDPNVNEKFIVALTKSLQTRGKGKPMRLLYEREIPTDMLNFLVRNMYIPQETLIPGGLYLNFRDFISFPNIGVEDLEYQPMPPLPIAGLQLGKSIFSQIAKSDFLVSLPYQSFDYIIHFLREAAMDPKVSEINIALYRLAENSKVINALINAAKNGKHVNCLIELKARFDEEANIFWSNKLIEGGVKVSFSPLEIKVHSKICLVSRREHGKIQHYANLATGNFNEKSAKTYCDHSLFTTNKDITYDLSYIFKRMFGGKLNKKCRVLVPSPTDMRNKFMGLIDKEMKRARGGGEAYMILKMNSLSDEQMVLKLYEASCAGVKIQLIVRGMCCLVPGVKGISENITVRSIVDRYLEHARVYIFGNGGQELMYLSSADWMTRNLDRRVEVSFPILDKRIQQEVRDMIDIQLRDNTKAREMKSNKKWKYATRKPAEEVHRAQHEIYRYLKAKNN
ncbi:polyphosphate kinase 1 [Olivibacter sitiensis]|uniref:polyphosphate kinase 1 n=1 Tax=Olivibacter sitiensis TaxID=376470 RepID=UPI00042598D0|nr:polyphosphate kinase 1 [Olivibacter sitiensis]